MRYLYDVSESIILEADSVIRNHPYISDGKMIVSGKKGDVIPPLKAGSYLIEEQTGKNGVRTRYLAVCDKHYTVVQIACGAGTADFFDSEAHTKRVPVNYYIAPGLVNDSTFRGFEQDYGDALLPHIHPNQLGVYDPKYAQLDANWDSLTPEQIAERLHAIDLWYQAKGLAPLRGFATYTPSNSLLKGMKLIGWKILHSVVPEQNWSDGAWAINHWGMVNQPFYAADDDFRKPSHRANDGKHVLEMSMDSYHLYMPHVVNWGDNVLSPSHFLRWHRTVESGNYPERFRNFLMDYLKVAETCDSPYFLIAGFEFGRSFGVRSMTRHNRKGMEILIETAKTMPVVFATAFDVADYYEKFCPVHPDSVFTQRDYLAGTRIMDKPVNSGPSIGMEMSDYKAVFDHLNPLPYYHYDYTIPWHFRADDTKCPMDFANDDKKTVSVKFENDEVVISAGTQLVRPVPVALWDAVPADCSKNSLKFYYPAVLDDGRKHSVAVLPKNFSGTVTLKLTKTGEAPKAEFKGLTHPAWRVQTIGEGEHTQCYLYIEEKLLKSVTIPFTVPAACRIDSLEKPLGTFKTGDKVDLTFDTRKTWFRFYGLTADQIQPSAEACAILDNICKDSNMFFGDAADVLKKIHAEQDARAAARIPADEKVLLDIDCFGNSIFGERSRAFPFDRLVSRCDDRFDAREHSDGGISLGHGVSFWVHPRGLGFGVEGVEHMTPGPDGMIYFRLYNVTPALEKKKHVYEISASLNGMSVFSDSEPWVVPFDPDDPDTVRVIAFPKDKISPGKLNFRISAKQLGVLDDWFADGGFIATLCRLTVTVKK